MRLQEFAIIKPEQINQLEKYVDRLFNAVGLDVGFTRHFKERLNDKRNKRPITIIELQRLFKKVHRQMHKGKDLIELGPNAEAVLKDLETDINVPFVLKWDNQNKEFDLISKTIMRKPDFKTSNDILAVESATEIDIFSNQLINLSDEISNNPSLFENNEDFNELRNFLSQFKTEPTANNDYIYSAILSIVPGKVIDIKSFDTTCTLIKTNGTHFWFNVNGEIKKFPESDTIEDNLLRTTLLFRNIKEKDQFVLMLSLKFSDWVIRNNHIPCEY